MTAPNGGQAMPALATWPGGMALRLSADRLVLDPAGAGVVVAALDRLSRVDRITLSPQLRALRDMAADVASQGRRGPADAASQAGCGPADVRTRPTQAPLPHDEITSREAAQIMGLSDRHITRLAKAGAFGRTRIHKGRLLLSAAEVEAYKACAREEER
jgi:excisionase family DNA binding protein